MSDKLLILGFLLFFFLPVIRGQKGPASRPITADVAMDMVMRIPEVKEANAYVRKHTDGKRKLFLLIDGKPTIERPYYWVAVGEDNGMSFVTHFHFYVYVRGGKITYYDVFNNVEISLLTWRKNRAKG